MGINLQEKISFHVSFYHPVFPSGDNSSEKTNGMPFVFWRANIKNV